MNQTLYASPDLRDPLLVYQNGSVCPTNPNERATTIIRVSLAGLLHIHTRITPVADIASQFICSPTDFHAGKPVLIAAVPPGQPDQACHFVFEWRSHVACPTNRKSELEAGHYIAFGSM